MGGGGAKGLAHIEVLKVLDRLGVEVVAISGTSVGAIIGSLYAAGRSGSEVEKIIGEMLATPRSIEEALKSERLFGWIELLGLDPGKSHILEAEGFLTELVEYLGKSAFEELAIPLKIVAADFWERREVVFDSGPLMPAIAASFSLPGIFKPVVIDDRALVDGGCVNPVPFDLIRDQCDILVAVDVIGKRAPLDSNLIPGMTEALFNTFQIAEKTIASQKMLLSTPDIYIEPEIEGVKVLEFDKADVIVEMSRPECARLESELRSLLGTAEALSLIHI